MGFPKYTIEGKDRGLPQTRSTDGVLLRSLIPRPNFRCWICLLGWLTFCGVGHDFRLLRPLALAGNQPTNVLFTYSTYVGVCYSDVSAYVKAGASGCAALLPLFAMVWNKKQQVATLGGRQGYDSVTMFRKAHGVHEIYIYSRFEATQRALGSQKNCPCLVCVLQHTQLCQHRRFQFSGRCLRFYKIACSGQSTSTGGYFRGFYRIKTEWIRYTPVAVELRGAQKWSW